LPDDALDWPPLPPEKEAAIWDYIATKKHRYMNQPNFIRLGCYPDEIDLPFVKLKAKIRVKLTDDDGMALTCFPREYTNIESTALWDTGSETTTICGDASLGHREIRPGLAFIQ